jgi:hypothetical protein
LKGKCTSVQVNDIIEDLNQKLYPDLVKYKPNYKPVVHRKMYVQKASTLTMKSPPKNYVRENYMNMSMTTSKNYITHDIKNHNRMKSQSSIFTSKRTSVAAAGGGSGL